jgi:hypothetical protein
MTEPKKPQTVDFDPGDWLARMDAYGYVVNLSPDVSGRLGLSTQYPRDRPHDVEDPDLELNQAPENYWKLRAYLLANGRVSHLPFNATQKAIIRQMKRRGLLHRPRDREAVLNYGAVRVAAGERGVLYMRMGFAVPVIQQGRAQP